MNHNIKSVSTHHYNQDDAQKFLEEHEKVDRVSWHRIMRVDKTCKYGQGRPLPPPFFPALESEVQRMERCKLPCLGFRSCFKVFSLVAGTLVLRSVRSDTKTVAVEQRQSRDFDMTKLPKALSAATCMYDPYIRQRHPFV